MKFLKRLVPLLFIPLLLSGCATVDMSLDLSREPNNFSALIQLDRNIAALAKSEWDSTVQNAREECEKQNGCNFEEVGDETYTGFRLTRSLEFKDGRAVSEDGQFAIERYEKGGEVQVSIHMNLVGTESQVSQDSSIDPGSVIKGSFSVKLPKDAKDVQTIDGTYNSEDQTITWPIDFNAKREQTFEFSYQQTKSFASIIVPVAIGMLIVGLLILGVAGFLASRDRKKTPDNLEN